MKHSVYLIVVFVATCVSVMCAEVEDLKKFDKIQIGQTQEEVIKLMGDPLVESDNKLYYGQVPNLRIDQSPMSPRRISITLKKGLVVRVVFYSDFQRFTLKRSFDKQLVTRLLKMDAAE